MSNTKQNTEKEFLNEESLNTEESTNTAESQDVCNETTAQGEPVETVETLKAELEALKDKYLRTVAEFDNYKKRTLKEKTELILNGSEKTVQHSFQSSMIWKERLQMQVSQQILQR